MRRLIGIGVVVLASSFVAPRAASAQAKMGDREVLVNGLVSTVSAGGSSFTFGQAVLNLGQFFSDTLEVGGGPILNFSGGFGNTHVGFGINGFGRKYFVLMSNAKLRPYVAGELFVQDFSPQSGSIGANTFVNGVGGLKNYLSEKAALEYQLSYGVAVAAPDFGDRQKILQFKVGITYLF